MTEIRLAEIGEKALMLRVPDPRRHLTLQELGLLDLAQNAIPELVAEVFRLRKLLRAYHERDNIRAAFNEESG